MPQVSPEEFLEWMGLPVTREVFNYLRALREKAKEDWAQEVFFSERGDTTLMLNAGAIERAKLLAALLELDFPELADGLGYKEMVE